MTPRTLRSVFAVVAAAASMLAGCGGVPAGATVVQDVDFERYVGRWYEIARLDHAFERGLEDVRATYSWREDGGIDVLNEGFEVRTARWKQARGKASLVAGPHVGRLKVSFFGPFYAAYNIIALEGADGPSAPYVHALVCGPDHSYLWILSRTPDMPPAVRDAFVDEAKRAGFNTEALIWVRHGIASGDGAD